MGKLLKTHCLSSRRENCLTVQMHSDAQWICLQKEILVLTRKVILYPYSFNNDYFVSLRMRFPKLTVFVEGKKKVDCTSKYLENVRDLDEISCSPIKDVHKDFVISCSNHSKIEEPWKPKEKFWHGSEIKSASLYHWLEKSKKGNTDGDHSHVSNVNSSFERLHVSSSKQ